MNILSLSINLFFSCCILYLCFLVFPHHLVGAYISTQSILVEPRYDKDVFAVKNFTDNFTVGKCPFAGYSVVAIATLSFFCDRTHENESQPGLVFLLGTFSCVI